MLNMVCAMYVPTRGTSCAQSVKMDLFFIEKKLCKNYYPHLLKTRPIFSSAKNSKQIKSSNEFL